MKYRKLTYKRKFFLLLVICLVCPFFLYRIAISETLRIRRELIETAKNLAEMIDAPRKIANLESKIDNMNLLIGGNKDNISDYQTNVLNTIASLSEKYSVNLRNFPQLHIWSQGNYDFITCFAQLQGSFNHLVRLLYDLETSCPYGRVKSVEFLSIEDRQTKKKELVMSLQIQTIKTKKHE